MYVQNARYLSTGFRPPVPERSLWISPDTGGFVDQLFPRTLRQLLHSGGKLSERSFDSSPLCAEPLSSHSALVTIQYFLSFMHIPTAWEPTVRHEFAKLVGALHSGLCAWSTLHATCAVLVLLVASGTNAVSVSAVQSPPIFPMRCFGFCRSGGLAHLALVFLTRYRKFHVASGRPVRSPRGTGNEVHVCRPDHLHRLVLRQLLDAAQNPFVFS